MRVYKSEVDLWFKILTASILILPILFMPFGGLVIWPAVLICAATAAFMVWLCLATKYEITEDALIIYGGVFKVNIRKSDITSIRESRSIISSPAFSLDRLEIQYEAGKMILISPKNRAEFLENLGWPKP